MRPPVRHAGSEGARLADCTCARTSAMDLLPPSRRADLVDSTLRPLYMQSKWTCALCQDHVAGGVSRVQPRGVSATCLDLLAALDLDAPALLHVVDPDPSLWPASGASGAPISTPRVPAHARAHLTSWGVLALLHLLLLQLLLEPGGCRRGAGRAGGGPGRQGTHKRTPGPRPAPQVSAARPAPLPGSCPAAVAAACRGCARLCTGGHAARARAASAPAPGGCRLQTPCVASPWRWLRRQSWRTKHAEQLGPACSDPLQAAQMLAGA